MERKSGLLNEKKSGVNISHETLSTSSDGRKPSTYKNESYSLFEFSLSPHLNHLPKRAKSLKDSLKEADIDYPRIQASCYKHAILSPLPEPVEEDASEDSYVIPPFYNLNREEKEIDDLKVAMMRTSSVKEI